MKKLIFLIIFIFAVAFANACPTCEAAQPKILRGISAHGRGPENGWDYMILCVSLVVFLLTLVFSIKFLVRPGEHSVGHIKNFILNEE